MFSPELDSTNIVAMPVEIPCKDTDVNIVNIITF